MPCAVSNAISLQRENIIENRPFVPPNDCIALIRRVRFMECSSSRMISVAADTDTGAMTERSGSISARHVGHVFFVFNDLSKHDVQKMCPHAVMDTFLVPGTSKHTAHTSTSASASASGWSGGVGVGEDEDDGECEG